MTKSRLVVAAALAVCACDKPANERPPEQVNSASNANAAGPPETTGNTGTTGSASATNAAAAQPSSDEPTSDAFEAGTFDADDLPEGIEVKGKLVDGARFEDEAGINIVVLSKDQESLDLYAAHWVVAEGASPKVVREVKQLQGECEFDYSADFVDGALTTTDLDQDGTGEITVVYKYTCTSDVSPQDYKVVVLEGGDKSILRGSEILMFPGESEPFGSGKFEAEGFENSPKLREHAVKTWKRYVLTRL